MCFPNHQTTITRFDPEAVSMLCSMGFAESHVHAALKSFRLQLHGGFVVTKVYTPRKRTRYPTADVLEKGVTPFKYVFNFCSAYICCFICLMRVWMHVCESLLLERLHLNPSCKNCITHPGVVCLAYIQGEKWPLFKGSNGIQDWRFWILQLQESRTSFCQENVSSLIFVWSFLCLIF